MNVIISNRYSEMLTNLPIDIIKNVRGEYEPEVIVSNFQNFFFNKMILDITAVKGYKNISNIQNEKLKEKVEAEIDFKFDDENPVLIDNIEANLYVELQNKILPFFVSFFPNIQFIVTTHSTFVLNSIDNAIIPMLVPHFNKIYNFDLRHNNINIINEINSIKPDIVLLLGLPGGYLDSTSEIFRFT